MMRACRLFAPLALGTVLALGGCSILPQSEPLDIYRLPVNQPSTPGKALPWSLQLLKPQASDALNSARIAVIPQGDLLSSYKASRWTDPAPILLRNRLLDGFQRDGRVQLLSTDDSNLQTDLALGGDLQAFQTEYQGKAAQVVIRLDARLIRGADQKILASRRFEVRQPLAETRVPAVVTGFGQASDVLARQVVDWAVGQGNQVGKR
ncbi:MULTISPECIES: ABC-type transport auxiliary lipoprotein family protein [Pseudomonas]|uniref:ABC-type transport auxiliary lipoprotein family protein n=1 Tax=Pseudomonas piscis TaxID=2614538 RepID=A0ABY9NHI1_9PSED|nr:MULTISPECIES: ABC-type transport auxiliary lipoprotein family protein [Pseudomonas]POA57889.1 ABC transporter [Pseudomonas sp. FW507-12TSA]WMN17924.1 ABC-type transport auxiliary lipoprotein family protein [Pseudomonas piscis]